VVGRKALQPKLNRRGVGLSDDEDSDEGDQDAENAKEKESKGENILEIESGLFNNIEDLATKNDMEVWSTDGDFVHASYVIR
jgi:hypothetical protein